GQTRRIAVELPTNTRKRFMVPAFTGTGAYSTWDARLIDERRKVRAEKTGLRPRGLASDSILLGAVPRTFGGLPKFPELKNNNNRSPMQPVVARLPVEQFPDDPTTLESLDAIYLNSEKALEMKVSQAAALLAWLHQGGHLILGVEQPSDVNANSSFRRNAAAARSPFSCSVRSASHSVPGRTVIGFGPSWAAFRRVGLARPNGSLTAARVLTVFSAR